MPVTKPITITTIYEKEDIFKYFEENEVYDIIFT